MGQSQSNYIIDKPDEKSVAYGETAFQTKSRIEIEELCNRLEAITYDEYAGGNLIHQEKCELDSFKLKCNSFKQYQEEILREMNARRKSGYGNPDYFGDKRLEGVFGGPIDPIIIKEEKFRKSIDLRKKKEIYDKLIKN